MKTGITIIVIALKFSGGFDRHVEVVSGCVSWYVYQLSHFAFIFTSLVLNFGVQVRKSMCRIKQVLTERALAVEDGSKKEAYRNMINCM